MAFQKKRRNVQTKYVHVLNVLGRNKMRFLGFNWGGILPTHNNNVSE